MKFEHVYESLRDYRTAKGEKLLFVLQKQTMQAIYDCIVTTRAAQCLELGTGYGATTCVIAAALDEIGGGRVTTVDKIGRDPIGVDVLAEHTGLSRYIDAVVTSEGYNWYLAEVVARQSSGRTCEPCFDFCFLDGA